MCLLDNLKLHVQLILFFYWRALNINQKKHEICYLQFIVIINLYSRIKSIDFSETLKYPLQFLHEKSGDSDVCLVHHYMLGALWHDEYWIDGWMNEPVLLSYTLHAWGLPIIGSLVWYESLAMSLSNIHQIPEPKELLLGKKSYLFWKRPICPDFNKNYIWI